MLQSLKVRVRSHELWLQPQRSQDQFCSVAVQQWGCQELRAKVIFHEDSPIVAVAGRKKVRIGDVSAIGRKKEGRGRGRASRAPVQSDISAWTLKC